MFCCISLQHKWLKATSYAGPFSQVRIGPWLLVYSSIRWFFKLSPCILIKEV
jgi:hypothetical protein